MIDANDTVTCPDQPEYGIADCGDAAGEGQRLVTAFEKAKLLQQSRDRRIVNTGVKRAVALTFEARFHFFIGVEREQRGLIDGW